MKIVFFQFLIKIEIHKKSVYRKYNSFFDLKTKQILKIFHFSFFNFKAKIEKRKNFWISFFDIKSKNWFENFDFCFLKMVLNQNRFNKFFLSFFFFQFNNQIRKMEDIYSSVYKTFIWFSIEVFGWKLNSDPIFNSI